MAVPEIALRFREAVKDTVGLLREHPLIGPRYPLRNLSFTICAHGLKSASRRYTYYVSEMTAIRVIRILHQKRNVRRILEKDRDV